MHQDSEFRADSLSTFCSYDPRTEVHLFLQSDGARIYPVVEQVKV